MDTKKFSETFFQTFMSTYLVDFKTMSRKNLVSFLKAWFELKFSLQEFPFELMGFNTVEEFVSRSTFHCRDAVPSSLDGRLQFTYTLESGQTGSVGGTVTLRSAS